MFIFRGVGWLNELTQEKYQHDFLKISTEKQEKLMTEFVESNRGHNWISTLLTYLLEGLLADPVYGSNKNGSGWKWLQHQPGFPSPPKDKTWDQLLLRRTQA